MQLRPAGAAVARARRAVAPAWHALIQVATGADPAPARWWRSPWQRRVAALGLAAATAAAIAASVAYGTLGIGGRQGSQKGLQGQIHSPPPGAGG